MLIIIPLWILVMALAVFIMVFIWRLDALTPEQYWFWLDIAQFIFFCGLLLLGFAPDLEIVYLWEGI